MGDRKATTVRRQARGELRAAQLLEAAAEVFAELGYEKATTNAIAARAGASPGTLYQFFPNKEAMAAALADRYLRVLGEIFTPDIGGLPVPELAAHMVDPIVAFALANPGFMALFVGPTAPEKLAPSALHVYNAILAQIEKLLESVAPQVPADRRVRCAKVTVQLIKAMLPMVLTASSGERPALVDELKQVLKGYVGPLRQQAV